MITGNDAGGGGNHVLNLCYYSKDIFRCTIAAIGEGVVIDKAKKLDIETVQFNGKCIYDGSIIKYIKENDIDIVNFHGAKAFFMHYFLKNKLTIPSVATIHSNYKMDFLNNKIKHLLFTPLSIKGIKSFKNFICVSKYIKELLEDDKIDGWKFIVRNGLDLSNLNVSYDRKAIRDMLNIDENTFVFVNVARMHPVKNHSDLIEAFAKLKKEKEDIKLLLVGDGVLREEIEDKVKELSIDRDVIFTGFVNNAVDFINASDISILTSFSEGGAPPLFILESSAVKKTIISTLVGDIDEIINQENGYLINSNEVNSIYEKMAEAYSERDQLSTKGNKLYEYVTRNYSMQRFCSEYYNAYKELLSSYNKLERKNGQ